MNVEILNIRQVLGVDCFGKNNMTLYIILLLI